MKSLSLCEDLCPELIPVIPSSQLGDGADGEVFEIQDTPDKVIKFSILYEYSIPVEQEFERIENVLHFLQDTRPSAYARVFDFKRLADGSRKTFSSSQRYLLYYYIMEKCFKISDDEKKVFHSILSHEDRGINKNYSATQLKRILSELSMGLDFDINKVIDFCKTIASIPIIHSDIHPRNIMKDQFGNFCLIDFDRCQLTSL